MTRKGAWILANVIMAGQACAQQVPWPAPVMPYLPFLAMPATPAQPLPPQFLPPQNVPFPMPFWFWYVPSPATMPYPTVRPLPEEAKVEARPEIKAVPELSLSEKDRPVAIVPQTPAPVPGPAVEQTTEPLPRAEPVPETVTAVETLPQPGTVSERAGPPPKAEVVKKTTGKPFAATSKPAKKTRKLCWKDGRLDVCQ